MSAIPADASREVVSMLEEQATIVRELADVAARQSSLIESNRTDDLLEVLEARQRLVKQFDVSQTRVAAALEAAPNPLSDSSRARMDELIAEITERVECVLQRDEADRQALVGARDAAGSELKRVDSSLRARRAYGSGARVDNRFADERG